IRLQILEPAAHEGELYPLGEEITVGRGGGCGIVLPDDHFVSTVHARVFRRGDEVYVEDLGSRNGTFVNGSPVASPIRLRRGDRVQFGETVAEVVR
ncbi:MAG TPA: FHA domain-containing protein, partial [Acidimicrobiia bacterium]|nr:FHA domain-containing protein [Acidimicrobiia bacterium]